MSETPPEIVTDVEETAGSLEEQAEKLRAFREHLDEASDRVTDMEPRERDAFYSKAADIRGKLDDVTTVDGLLELEEEIEEAVRSPLQQATLNALEEFLDVVDPNLSGETREDVEDGIKRSVPADLQKITDTYGALISRSKELPELLQRKVAERVEQHPTELTNPDAELDPFVEKLERRHDQLSTFDEMFEQAGDWAPETDLAATARFYDKLDYPLAQGQGKKYIDDVEERVAGLDDTELGIKELARKELEQQLDDATVDEIVSALQDIVSGLSTLTDQYETLSEFEAAIEQFGTDKGVFEGPIDDLLAETEQIRLQVYNAVLTLREDIQSLIGDYKQFFEEVAERLNAQREMVEDLRKEFSELEDPDVGFAADRQENINGVTVRQDPYAALQACAAYDTWVEKAFEELSGDFDSEAVVDIWRQLYDGQAVRLSDSNRDALLALADRFKLDVVLGSE